MFCKNNLQQTSLFEPITQMPKYLQDILNKSWAKAFNDYIFPQINEERFSVLYSNKASRPNTPINVILGLLIWTTIVLIPYIHVTIDIRTTDSTVNVSSCGYSSRINIDDITEITLIDSLPDDHFFRYNGGATDSYLVGKFKGNTYGKCNLYIFNDVSPVLMIKTADQTVFLNSKKDGEIVNLYNTIKDK